MKSVLYFLVLVWQLVGSPVSATVGERKDHDDVIVHNLDFDVHTYVPVTKELIEEKANCRFVFSANSAETRTLLKTFGGLREGNFDDSFVRLKISNLWEQTIFVDAWGGVTLGQSGSEQSLTIQDYRDLRSLLEFRAEQQGCRIPLIWEPDDQPDAEPQ